MGRDRGRSWGTEYDIVTGLLLAAPLIIFVAAMLIYPLEKLIAILFGGAGVGANIAKFFASGANTRTIVLTFGYSGVVTLICVVVGAVLAWSLHTATSRSVKTVLLIAIVAPFLMGSVIKLYALVVMLESRGVVNKALIGLQLTGTPIRLLYNQFAVVLGLTYYMLPFAVLPLLAGFQSINPDLVRAAESLGAGRIRALFSTVVPLSIPSILATGSIIYIICLGFYLAPEVLGGPTSPFSAALIAQDVFQFYDLTSAAVSALVLLIGSLLVILLAYLLVGRERLARVVAP